jgi:DNA-binding cell septation regulator SpoVG
MKVTSAHIDCYWKGEHKAIVTVCLDEILMIHSITVYRSPDNGEFSVKFPGGMRDGRYSSDVHPIHGDLREEIVRACSEAFEEYERNEKRKRNHRVKLRRKRERISRPQIQPRPAVSP